jgi:hypothetical protein
MGQSKTQKKGLATKAEKRPPSKKNEQKAQKK